MDGTKDVPAVIRTLRLLETLAGTREGLMAGELSQKLAVSRSTLFTLLNTLKAHHYIQQPDERGPYQLGPALYALLPGYSRRIGLLVEAFHADTDIAAMPETTALVWLDGKNTTIIAQKESQHPVHVVLHPGERQSLTTTAAGLALWAGMADTAVSPSLQPTLRQIWQDGLAQIQDTDKVEIAVPICADGIQPIAALLLSIPAYRYRAEAAVSLIQSLRRIAARLSYRLGAPVYQPYSWASGDPLEPTTMLSQEEVSHFLHQPWGARLACIRPDGTPHVVPLWYEWDGRYFWLVASPGAYWQTYVSENNRISLTVDEPWPPLRRALIIGQVHPATNAEIPGGLVALRHRLANRYLGQGAASRAEFQDGVGWHAFCVRPEKISGYRGLGPGVHSQ